MASTSRASILILEDDDPFRRVLVRALRGAGYSVVGTGNANDAITLLSGDAAFDLLISDINMPRFQPHGIAVGNIAKLKRSRIKIIYITGDPGQVPSGFIDVKETPLIAKPFDVVTLLAAIEAVLGTPK
jgi:CheY-like chemotaxis protein